MHPWARNEWWYVVGHLRDSAGHRYGFETTLFKLNHLQLPGSGASLSVLRTDVALTLVNQNRFISRVSYVEPGLAPVVLSTRRLNERIGNAAITAAGQKRIRLQSSVHGARLHLSLTVARAPLLEGGRGLVPMGSGGSSYYYSLPQLRVTGSLTYHGRRRAVTGIAWLDHQWGNWHWARIDGWTWGAVQLADRLDFSLAVFRAVGGSLRGISSSSSRGHQRVLRRFVLRSLGRWRSPHDHVVYPSGWRLKIPALQARLLIRPLVSDQEVYDPIARRSSYWEGACSVAGIMRGRRVHGLAYMEVVGTAGHFGS